MCGWLYSSKISVPHLPPSSTLAMPLTFHPKRGQILMCDFQTGFRPPEMVKCRPVVVLSDRHRELATVVPISTTEPYPIEACHHELAEASMPLPLRGKPHWAKCDMITTVALTRMDRVRARHRHPTTGKRMYFTQAVTSEDLEAITKAVLSVLGVQELT